MQSLSAHVPQDSPVKSLIKDAYVTVIPAAAQKDGMALKPGIHVDSHKGVIVGTTDTIDSKYVRDCPSPDREHLKNIFIKEAECVGITTLEHELSMPVGVDYIPGKISKYQTKEAIEMTVKQLQTCLECLKSNPSSNGIVPNCKCTPIAQSDLEEQHFHSITSLRPCSSCHQKGLHCMKLLVLVMAMDSESRNRGAEELFAEAKHAESLDPEFEMISMMPDAPHVGKRMNCHFSNWFLIFDGNRINRVLLRTLRADKDLKLKLSKLQRQNEC